MRPGAVSVEATLGRLGTRYEIRPHKNHVVFSAT
jgi:hypothetical protein